MNLKKLLFISSISFLTMGLLFANGSSEESDSKDMNEGPVTISYYTWDDGCHQALIDEFNKTHTDIQVDGHILASADYETKLTTLLSGRADIDAFMEKRQSDVFSQYENGYLEPLDSYIEATGSKNQAVENFKSAVTIDDGIYQLPWRGGAYFTYFNKNVFEKAGIPTPDTYVENGEWTWEKFEEVSKAIHAADSSLIGSSIYMWGSQAFFKAGQEGDSIVTADGKIDNIENVVDILEMRKRLEDEGAMWNLIDMKVTKTHYSKQFYDGNLGMLLIGEWFPGQMVTGAADGLYDFDFEDWGITRLPCDREPYYTVGLPTSNCITSYSKKKQAAFEFINWMSGPEGSAIAAKYGVLPAASSEAAKQEIAKNLPDEKSVEYFLENRNNNTANFSPYATRVETEFAKLQEDYLLGNLTTDEFRTEFIDSLEEIIRTTY
ncbi:MAG: extracellular solute-binding protein [Sphaerochaetaceae bacterium]|nr:extracellular solute-binding protein [Sphaerochaetaceae bacterium]MDC7237248.1 extracellular solute-binding protein [Sphaerochaetaceae bacterium]